MRREVGDIAFADLIHFAEGIVIVHGGKSCFASLLVIQPGVPYGSALIDAASSVLLLPSRRRADGAEGEPCNSSDFHQSHKLIIRPSSLDLGDRRIFFPTKVTIKRCPPHLAQGLESLRQGKALDGEPSWPNCLLTRYVLSPEAKEDLGDIRGHLVCQGGAKT